MYVEVKYGERTFGNDENCEHFAVQIHAPTSTSTDSNMSMRFIFDGEKDGRSLNPMTRGMVSGARITMKAEDARRLAIAMLWSLESNENSSILLFFPKDTGQNG